jgi:hypothetical protein
MAAPSFERDIKPLFREHDRTEMDFMFDLWSHDEVSEHAEDIYSRIEDGSMPCDGEWPPEQVSLLRAWIDGGCAP